MADGNWKLRYAHCMWKVDSYVVIFISKVLWYDGTRVVIHISYFLIQKYDGTMVRG